MFLLPQWTTGLQATAEGRIEEAQKFLGSLASQISLGIANVVVSAGAAGQAAVLESIIAFLGKVAIAIGECYDLN